MKKYPFPIAFLSMAILLWGLPSLAGAESSQSLQNKAKSFQSLTNVKPKAGASSTAPGVSVPPLPRKSVPNLPTGLPPGANIPKPKLPPNLGKSIQSVPGSKGLGQGNIGKGLPGGVALPHGVGSKGLGKGLPSGSPPGKFSESGKFQKFLGPIAGPGTGHSPVQKQDTDKEEGGFSDEEFAAEMTREDMVKAGEEAAESSSHTGDVASSPVHINGEAQSDPGDEDPSGSSSSDKPGEITFTEEESEADRKAAGVGEQCPQGAANCPSSERMADGGDVPDSDKAEDYTRIGQATKPKGALGETVRFVPGEEPGGEGGQPTHFVPSPVMVNPGQDVDLPPGAFEDLNKNLQQKIISGDKPHVDFNQAR
jgi:hypothetical protein